MREAAEALMPDSSSSSLSRFEKTVRSTAPLFGSGDMTANLPGQFAWVQYGLTPFLRPNQPPHSRQKVGSSPMAATTFLWFILTPRPRVREPREGARWTSLFCEKDPRAKNRPILLAVTKVRRNGEQATASITAALDSDGRWLIPDRIRVLA